MDDLIKIVEDFWKTNHCTHAVVKTLIQYNNYPNDTHSLLDGLTAFGEGMGERAICGSVSGALISLGTMLNEGNLSSKTIKHRVDNFKSEFKKENNSLYCYELLSPYLEEDEPYPDDPIRLPICTKAVKSAVTIAQKIIDETINQNLNVDSIE